MCIEQLLVSELSIQLNEKNPALCWSYKQAQRLIPEIYSNQKTGKLYVPFISCLQGRRKIRVTLSKDFFDHRL